MSPKLRPLQLPLLVEHRKRMEEGQVDPCDADHSPLSGALESSFSDVSTPVTPTFSVRGHLRYSSSTSSFDLTTSSSVSEPPSSPTQLLHKQQVSTLPDVQEEPLEAHPSDSDQLSESELSDLYDCLCENGPCVHKETHLIQSATDLYDLDYRGDIDYDLGFLSDGDLDLPQTRKRRAGSESHFHGLTDRLGSRFPTLTRWKSQRKASITTSPVPDLGGFDSRSRYSRTTSSRSSSISRSGRFQLDRSNEPPLPPTPALSYHGSAEDVAILAPIAIEKANELGPLIERDRALATTPLLPPLLRDTDAAAESATAQPSPLESPKVATHVLPELPESALPSPTVTSPPLSSRPSISSFHRVFIPVDFTHIPQQDAWADRLGHANFTIVPEPYTPDEHNVQTMRRLRADWDLARVNYTKHLVRTGEHYGLTSKIYGLTEAKWAEIDDVWRVRFDENAKAVGASGIADSCGAFDEGVITTVPQMGREGKFPERGDEDIVGPMTRAAPRSPSVDAADKSSPGFWRALAGRVGIKK